MGVFELLLPNYQAIYAYNGILERLYSKKNSVTFALDCLISKTHQKLESRRTNLFYENKTF